MAYTLTTAISELKRSMLWNERVVVREPLEGLVDGSNAVFYTVQRPVSSTGITVYDNAGTEFSSGSYTIDSYEFGTVRFTSTAPTATYYISYTAQSLTDTQLTNIVKNGFDKMEQEYSRGWYITDSSISSSSSSVIDPTIGGGLTFSVSRLHVSFYLLCCEWALAFALRKYAAANYFRYRENRASGVQIDRSMNADQLKVIMDDLQEQITDVVVQVADQSGDAPWGSFTPAGHSDQWSTGWDWWTDSKQDRGEIA